VGIPVRSSGPARPAHLPAPAGPGPARLRQYRRRYRKL